MINHWKQLTQKIAKCAHGVLPRLLLGLSIMLALLSAGVAEAKTTAWTNTVGGAWTLAANWTNGVPAAGDDVIIATNLTGNITAVPAINLGSLTVASRCVLAAAASGNILGVTNYTVNAGVTNTIGIGGGRFAFTLFGKGIVNGKCAFDAGGGGTVRAFTVTNKATLIVNPGGRVYDPNMGGASAFLLSSGATLMIGQSSGITNFTGTSSTANTNVAINFGAASSFSTNANYVYIGIASQITGNGLPTNITSLTISNTLGTVTLQNVTSVKSNLTLTAGSKLSLPAGTNAALALYLGGVQQPRGTWGSTNSTAPPTYTNNTYFSGAGIVNVGTGVAPASFTNLTVSQSIAYGTAGLTLTGQLVAVGPTYPTNGETVAVTFNGVTTNLVMAGGVGAFTNVLSTATLPTGIYTVTFGYPGSSLLIGSTNTGTTVTVTPAPLTVSAIAGTAPYGTAYTNVGPGRTTFTSSGLTNGETIGTVTILATSAPWSGTNATDPAGTYTLTPTNATGGTFGATNLQYHLLAGAAHPGQGEFDCHAEWRHQCL